MDVWRPDTVSSADVPGDLCTQYPRTYCAARIVNLPWGAGALRPAKG